MGRAQVLLTYPPVLNPGHNGSYGLAVEGDYASPTGGSTFLSFRWAPTTSGICVLQRVDLSLAMLGATTLHNSLGFFIARSFTAPATGGTAITPSKKRATYPASEVADLRYGQSAALTSGTRVLDSVPFLLQTVKIAASAVGTLDHKIDAFGTPSSDDPIVLVSGEGIELVCVSGGTGACRWVARLEWMELDRGAF